MTEEHPQVVASAIAWAVREACELPGDDGNIPDEQRLVMRVSDLRSIVHGAILQVQDASKPPNNRSQTVGWSGT